MNINETGSDGQPLGFDNALISFRFELSDLGNPIANDSHISATRGRTAAVNDHATANEN